MRKYLFLWLILCFSTVGFSQNPKLKTTALTAAAIEDKTYIGFDGLNNHYYIKNNIFIKQNDNQQWEYKNVALGKISMVDFINPLKIVVFYEDFNTVILLDNQLNEIQRLNIFDIDSTIFVSKIGMASQNQFWVYNALTQQIMLFDYLKNTAKNIGNPIQENIKYTQSDFNYFYWIDEINNWYAIDLFGKVTLLANIPPFEKMQIVDNERILFVKDNTLYCLNNKLKTVFEIEIVEKSFRNFYYKDQILAIFTNQQIKNYKIKLP
ncbi:hypothetical protein [Flavobacterium sedimenticola]|uniref:Uncharacterized protein n=1 Tax=Flavobacterium sedimenticola TaxID=3043286 RepID=A0ABT6XNA5_9FLAO|nr:hypothetical protein [Flavobacterium sedimenticola]MDI9256570.1 hypothetical protein [Flavobacterium sedimenticola]